jgi:predicted MFS family arabinose efflux permease
MATGPLTGGLIFDATGGYALLFVTSFALGLAACLIALTFKPVARPQEPVPAPA